MAEGNTLVSIHGYFMWVVLALAIITPVAFIAAWLGKRPYTNTHNRLSLFYTIAVDIQLLLGLVVYFFASGKIQYVFSFGSEALEDSTYRYYAIEHPAAMILAIAFVHAGRIVSRKGTDENARLRLGSIMFVIALILMLVRLPFGDVH